MSPAPQKWLLREARESDLPFVFNSWLKAYRDAGAVRGVPNTAYYNGQHDVIDEILHTAGVTCIIACDPKDTDQIFGWAVLVKEDKTVHMVYVKQPFRLFGIAKALLTIMGIIGPFVYSHRTIVGENIAKKKGSSYVPFELLRRSYKSSAARNPGGKV
jgi:GNAT superfamily N-acetyltransferase